jgi:hypothetical protein
MRAGVPNVPWDDGYPMLLRSMPRLASAGSYGWLTSGLVEPAAVNR